ncbi:MAG: hypothetical protein RL318_2175 [Fibrobacterota bacterium]|jgi:hypothetical protein
MKFQKLLLAACLFAFLGGCDDVNSVAAGGSDETHTNVDISGAVLTERSEPFAGIVVKLRSLPLSDTTDLKGTYRLQQSSQSLAARTGAVDTLDFLREGRVVHSEVVPTWSTTMPTLFLTQRDISGKLTGKVGLVKTVEAIFGTDRKDTLALEWNPVLGSYSGFSYASWDGSVTSYQVRIEVRDSLHRLVGRSVDIPFTSRAGDIEVPVFPAGNAKPTLRLFGPDTASSREWLALRAVAQDSFGQKVVLKWREMKTAAKHLDFDSIQRITHVQSASDTVVHLPMPSGKDSTYVIHCTATDEDGLTVEDSLVVRRRFSLPQGQIEARVDGDSVRLHFALSDVNKGSLVQHRLFLGVREVVGWAAYGSCIDTSGMTIVLRDDGWTFQTLDPRPGPVVSNPCGFASGKEYRFLKRDSGVLVSGRDTTFALPPKDTSGNIHQIVVQVTDQDGESALVRSLPFDVVPGPDSLRLAILPGDSLSTYDILQVTWHPVSLGPLVWGADRWFESWQATMSGLGANQYRTTWTATDSTFQFSVPKGGDYQACVSLRQHFSRGVSLPSTICLAKDTVFFTTE